MIDCKAWRFAPPTRPPTGPFKAKTVQQHPKALSGIAREGFLTEGH